MALSDTQGGAERTKTLTSAIIIALVVDMSEAESVQVGGRRSGVGGYPKKKKKRSSKRFYSRVIPS